MKVRTIRIGLIATIISSVNLWAETATIESPDGLTIVEVSLTASDVSYTLSHQGQLLVESSSISLLEGANYESLGIERSAEDSSWEPVWGSYSLIRDHCSQLVFKLKASDLPLNLVCRVYNDGVGFRFAAPADAGWKDQSMNFSLQFNMPDDTEAYYTRGERDPMGPIPLGKLIKRGKRFNMPFVLESSKDTWLALLESDLYTAERFDEVANVIAIGDGSALRLEGKGIGNGQAFVTPWRVILVGGSLGDLLESTVALNLAAPCEIADTSWIKAGKGFWDWRVHGYDNGEFNYGINTQSYLRFIDFAAKHGIEYLTIDDHWYLGSPDGTLIADPAIDMPKVMAYAKEQGVEIVLYFDRRGRKGKLLADPELFEYFSSLGAAGMKYGFQGADVEFTRSSIQGTAENQLFIFYHDNPAAMTGVERTMPNFFTREFCHAQQDSRKAFSPTGFLKMAMINALTGPLDMANGNFGINSINAGEREKGPEKLNTYISTVVSEVARCLVISSGLITLPDAPEEYAKKPDLFEFLTAMPATWDETRVINSEMATYITTARRTGDTWFVGSVNNETPRDLEIELDFLEDGVAYEVEIFEDAADAHGETNPEVYRISKKMVTANDVIVAKMVMGGGHAMILSSVK
ncbi:MULTISPECIES: glycoside hydrolase family 97 protein [unclassified Lentimonas]|uniref:glycoside hydrolase family 97 protein n=1 Tax=unclassified Lentimonas TaxID=2630993 RepID=UPI001329D093|nr:MULTISPECIES: glycoside hydrolase family 97 protein [unclassified Lentimonas]CAA6676332.1 Unannotated [Lentimonas sp. CC4]CAA6683778.1 Unannotated [Lentimonas sp. CC6]CAA7077827.1 Alpha-glucosidase (EC [Lentimonas sp. CC4]CAA7169757.1 Unannotated [Lentimonas sp. CC21]CAA7179875.1 Unannotated [Lentimonas sp. CC8]